MPHSVPTFHRCSYTIICFFLSFWS